MVLIGIDPYPHSPQFEVAQVWFARAEDLGQQPPVPLHGNFCGRPLGIPSERDDPAMTWGLEDLFLLKMLYLQGQLEDKPPDFVIFSNHNCDGGKCFCPSLIWVLKRMSETPKSCN